MNQCHFIGRFVSDPQLKSVDKIDGKNTSVCNFKLAISRRFKKTNGEIGTQTVFLAFEIWDTGAEVVCKSFNKGDLIIVHCSARVNAYRDKESGRQLEQVVFRVNDFEFPSSMGIPKQPHSEDILPSEDN